MVPTVFVADHGTTNSLNKQQCNATIAPRQQQLYNASGTAVRPNSGGEPLFCGRICASARKSAKWRCVQQNKYVRAASVTADGETAAKKQSGSA
jgi:hypothetical protein